MEYCLTESERVFSRKNQLSGFGISPSELDKKTHLQELYSKIYAKRHPKKGTKQMNWSEILQYLKEKQEKKMIPLEINLDKLDVKSLEGWFTIRQKKFKKRPQMSSRFFRTYKNELLNELLIIQLQNSNKRTKYYSITPLGICYLVKNRNYGLNGKMIEKTLKILNTFYQQSTLKIFNIKKKFDFQDIIDKTSGKNLDHNMVKIINNLLHNQVEYSKSSFDNYPYYISIRYPISFNLENIIARFVIRKNEIKYYENLVIKEGLLVTKYIDENLFHTYLSTFLLYGICYYVIKIYFDNFLSARKFTGINDFKFSDYDFKLNKIKNYNKDVLKIIILLNNYFSELLNDHSEISTQLKFFQNKIKEFESGVEPQNKIYKNDPNLSFMIETTDV